MENEASTALKQLLQKNKMILQLAPLCIYRQNAAKRAIRAFKNNFVAGLASLDNNFPIYLWCHKLKQAEITLNILRTSQTNQILLVYAKRFGAFDFDAIPVEPQGKKVN